MLSTGSEQQGHSISDPDKNFGFTCIFSSGMQEQTRILLSTAFDPCHEKTNILHMRKQRPDQPRGNHKADQRLVFTT